MHRCKLSRRSHGRERSIHLLTTGLIRAQETEDRWATRGDKGAKGLVVRGAEQLGFRRIAGE
eukprot:36300-Pleurochrysis_carterae.AAC.1